MSVFATGRPGPGSACPGPGLNDQAGGQSTRGSLDRLNGLDRLNSLNSPDRLNGLPTVPILMYINISVMPTCEHRLLS